MFNQKFTSKFELDNCVLLCCKYCNRFHPFKIYYDKKIDDLVLFYNCGNNDETIILSTFLSQLNTYSIKCFKCNNILNIKEKVFKTSDNNFHFLIQY